MFQKEEKWGGTMKPTTGRHGEDHSAARFMFAGAVWRVAFLCDFPHVGGGSGAGLGGHCLWDNHAGLLKHGELTLFSMANT